MEKKDVVLAFMVFYIATATVCGSDPVCCTPDQWEATMFWDNGNAFIDDHSSPEVGTVITYINGSLKTAYDFTSGRTFINASVMQISPLLPKPTVELTTLIRDYKNGIEYQFDTRKCAKTKLDPLKRHCIPGCLPVHVMYLVASSEAGSGAVYSLEVSDVTPGIKDPSIFDIPSQCRSGQTVFSKTSRWLQPFF